MSSNLMRARAVLARLFVCATSCSSLRVSTILPYTTSAGTSEAVAGRAVPS